MGFSYLTEVGACRAWLTPIAVNTELNPYALTSNFGIQVYDTLGNLKMQTDPRNNTTTYFYDPYNRRTSVVDATMHTTKYTYDGNNNKLTETDQNGNTTTYTYDNANRVSQILYADGTTQVFPSPLMISVATNSGKSIN